MIGIEKKSRFIARTFDFGYWPERQPVPWGLLVPQLILHDSPVALLNRSVLSTLQANASAEDDKQTGRGIGHCWKCHTCGYHRKWHLFPGTAASAANKHAQQSNHVTSVYPN